jgi:probable F420-dependent oxidoreductase
MTGLPDIHLALAGGERSALVGLAAEAERLGYGGVWVAEGPGRDAFSLLTEIALRTTAIELGTGIVNIYGRSPTALAQAAASLAEAAPGRAVHLGLGTGSRILIEGAYGLAYDRPFTRMRETIAIIRQALAGERVSLPGQVFRVERLKLSVSGQDRVDVYVAGLSPRMLAIAGEQADGWLPIWPSRRAFATALHGRVADAAAAAGRPAPHVAAYAYTCLDDDNNNDGRALAALRRSLAWYMTSAGPAYANLFRGYGHAEVVDAVQAKWRAGERAAARDAIPAEVVRDLAVTGRAEAVPAQLDELRRLGIARPVLRFPDDLPASEIARMLGRIAAAYADRELAQAR